MHLNIRENRAVFSVALTCFLAGCSTANVTKQVQIDPAPVAAPVVIYVSDFKLDRGTDSLSESQAEKLVNLMAYTLVKDLNKAGFKSVRLTAGLPLPREGWVVRGKFVEVQEGNRFSRALIGFGAGKTNLQAVAMIDRISHGSTKPFYELDTEASSGNRPVFLIGGIVRLLRSSDDLDKNVRQTASKMGVLIEREARQKTKSKNL